MKIIKILYLQFFLLIVFSCNKNVQVIDFPLSETEFAPPLVKKLGKPKVIKIKPLLIPSGEGRPDSIKPPEIVKLGKPKAVTFINNEKPLGKPEIVPFRQPDSVYYFNETLKSSLQKRYPGKTLVKVQKPVTKNVKPKIVLLGQPEKVTCKPAQEADNTISNLKFYSQDHGLVATKAQCMCLDKKGNLWVGTDGGICKFDGKEWWIYTVKQGLSANYVNSLLESPEGNLLIGTDGGGLNILDYNNQFLQHYTKAQGLSNNYVSSLLENSEGNLLIGTYGGGLNILDDKNQILLIYSKAQGLSTNIVLSLLESREGSLVIGTYGGGLNILDDQNQILQHYSTAQGLSNNNVFSLLGSREGNLLIGTSEGLNILDNKSLSIKRYSTEQGLSNNHVNSLLESREGNLLIGTNGNGLNILDDKSQSIKHYSTAQGLSNNIVLSLLESREGDLLIGTYGGGLNILDDKNLILQHYSTAQGLSNNTVRSILESCEGNLMIGTFGDGLSIIDTKSNSIKHYGMAQGFSNNSVRSMLENHEGNLLIGTYGGGLNILDFKSNSIKHYGTEQGFSNNYVYSLLESSDGNLIIGTDGGGLNILDNKNKNIKHCSSVQGLSNNVVLSLLESAEGNLVIGTDGGGLNILDDKKQILQIYNKAQGLSNNILLSILESREGNLLIGTYGGGLNILDTKSNIIKIYSMDQGLPNDGVFSISEDSLGNIWLGTGKGLCKLTKKKGEYVVQKNFDKREGLKFMDFNPNAMRISTKGKLWAGINQILTEINPYVFIDTIRPSICITAVEVQERKETWFTEKRIVEALRIKLVTEYDTIWSSAQDALYVNGTKPTDTSYFKKNNIKYTMVTEDIYHLPKSLVLPISQNHLTFHFTGICISPTAVRIRYRYIMHGLDKQWSPITEKSEADYRNIPPGNYSFKVAARSIDGYWSTPVEFAFKVLPPWYQTYWAYASYSFSFILIVYGVSQWRRNRIKKFASLLIKTQEYEKLRISRELHDDIGQELSFIRMKEEIKSKSDIDRVISKISNIAYNLKPIKLTDGSIKEILDDLLSNAENDVIFFSYEIEDLTIKNTDIKINLFRIVQEAVNNIIKHSQAENARVTLSVKDKNIVLEIMDDGIGINETIVKNRRSVGLTSMHERAGLINGKLRFEKTEKGTHLKLVFKI